MGKGLIRYCFRQIVVLTSGMIPELSNMAEAEPPCVLYGQRRRCACCDSAMIDELAEDPSRCLQVVLVCQVIQSGAGHPQ